MNIDSYRPFIAKVIAPFIGLAVTAVNKKYGFVLDDSVVGMAVAALTDIIVFSLSTGLSGVLINKKVNPGNAASAHLAAREKSEAETIKAKASMYDAARHSQ